MAEMTSDEATRQDALKAGREALTRSAWQEAFDLLAAADLQNPLAAEDLERLAEAALWTFRPDECVNAYERAYAGYMKLGNNRRAGYLALKIFQHYEGRQAPPVASGWFSRAVRLLDKEPESAEHGYLAHLQSLIALYGGDLDPALQLAKRTFEVGERFGDLDLQALGLNDQGLVLVAQGKPAEGMALLNEATVGAVNGELGLYTTGVIYCNVISTCRDLADYRHAGDWIDAAKRWCDRTAVSGFPGLCRVYRAEIMKLRGAWAEAEEDVRAACEDLRYFAPGYAGEALYELGEIRLRMGDLAGAKDAFRQAHELGRESQPGLALICLAEGKMEAAASMIGHALTEGLWDRLTRSRRLPAQVEIALAVGDLETARMAAEELEAIAGTFSSAAYHAAARCARGEVELAERDAAAALNSLRKGLRLWQEVDAPYEAARTRVLLSQAYRADGDEESARLELEAALSTFERLGADLDSRCVREALETAASDGARTPTPRRATKTFMFTDIVKSTPLLEALGDQAWDDVLNWHDKTLRLLFAAHAGEEFKHSGDGFSVAFDSAQAAVDCAVAIQHSFSEHRREHGFALQVRIGLHTSEATRRGKDYGGKGIHQAARIGALAGAEEIIASLETLDAAGPGVPASEPRAVTLKGISEPVKVVAINWREVRWRE